VASGNAEAGIVYKTDAAVSKEIKIVLEIPAAQGPKIRYPAALLTDSRHAAAAQRFLNYLTEKSATDVFEKFGFIVLK
jgi:molybdate transport system substrate-binding protein